MSVFILWTRLPEGAGGEEEEGGVEVDVEGFADDAACRHSLVGLLRGLGGGGGIEEDDAALELVCAGGRRKSNTGLAVAFASGTTTSGSVMGNLLSPLGVR